MSKLPTLKRVALFGGSFDPPHLGHAALVHAALDRLELDEVWVIPASLPVHRALSGLVGAEQKRVWLEKMFAAEPRVKVMSWELEAKRPVPTVETLRRFIALKRGVPLWLAGVDAWAGIESWVGYPEHQQLCNMAVFSRAGHALPQIAGWQSCSVEQWRNKYELQPGHVLQLEVQLPDISATEIRQRACNGLPLDGLVDASIIGEIEACYATGEQD